MAFQPVNIGSAPNDGTGDTLRDAFSKVNGNFSSLDFLGLDGLADPDTDKILFWDDSGDGTAWLTLGTLLSVSGTTLNVSSDAGKLDISGGTLTGSLNLYADPSTPLEAATKQYVDAVASGLDPKASCRLATITNHGLSGLSAVDGVVPSSGDRILVKNQTAGSENGIYIAASGAWSRSGDADEDTDVTAGLHCLVTEGNTHAKQGFILTTNDPITIGTTTLTFEQYSDISGTPTATETVLGGLEVGTQAEVDAGTLDNKIITPSKLANWTGSTNLTTLGAVTTISSLNMGDSQIIGPEFKDYSETLVQANTGTSYTINLQNGNTFELTVTANVTISFSNWPSNGKTGSCAVKFKQDATGARTITLPAAVKTPGGAALAFSTGANEYDWVIFTTTDGGSTVDAMLAGANFG